MRNNGVIVSLIRKWLGIVPFMLILVSSQVYAFKYGELNLRAYAGADIQRMNITFDHNDGGNLFKGHSNQTNYWAAFQFNRYLGVGVGYEKGHAGSRAVVIGDGDSYLGIPLLVGNGFENHETQRKLSGTHVELIGYFPLCPRYKLDLFGSLGAITNRLSLTDNFVGLDGVRAPNPIVRSYNVQKTVPRASLGLQKVFWKYVGIRALVNWEDNAEFYDLKPIENPNASTNVKLRDCFSYGVGIFVTI